MLLWFIFIALGAIVAWVLGIHGTAGALIGLLWMAFAFALLRCLPHRAP